ncbi:DUF2064 domain-containing protein [soil metagenome]
MTESPALVVLAKTPRPGASKTRLHPPCTYEEAAAIAAASLHDTLAAVAAARVARRVLVLDGAPPPGVPPGFEVLAQRGRGLGERLAAAFEDAGPSILIGMDTPQVTPALLEHALRSLHEPGIDAVLGHTLDGGYWTIGLRRPDRRAFCGVPMSSARTGAAQRRRLHELGLRVATVKRLRDVDFFDDALLVAQEIPGTRFGRVVGSFGSQYLRASA